jgi:hypothetical protein
MKCQAIEWYRHATDPNRFEYIPAAPSPQRTAQGDPAISLMSTDQFAMLQLSSEWQVSSEQQEELRSTIAEQTDLDPAEIELHLAPVRVETVILLLKNNQGEFESLATGKSSGYLPFSQVFSVSLSDAQKADAIAAFNGRKDQLIVTYQAVLEREIFVEVAISGDISKALKQLPKSPTLENCLDLIDDEIGKQRLKLTVSASPEATDDLHARTEQLAKKHAAELMLQLAQDSSIAYDRTKFQASASLSESITTPIERSADITTWFPNGKGMDYIQIF